MKSFRATLETFKPAGEKQNWTYCRIPVHVSEALNPGVKRSYRVKGWIDDFQFRQISLMPLGDGTLFIPVRVSIRKQIGKKRGDEVKLSIELDNSQPAPPADFLECLNDEPAAKKFYDSLKPGHKNYFINWIKEAKTEETKAKRIAVAVNGLAGQLDFGAILRRQKAERDQLRGIK